MDFHDRHAALTLGPDSPPSQHAAALEYVLSNPGDLLAVQSAVDALGRALTGLRDLVTYGPKGNAAMLPPVDPGFSLSLPGDPREIAIFIGGNHTGSYSFIRALKLAMGKKALDVETFGEVPAGVPLPSNQTMIEYVGESVRKEGYTLINSHVGIPFHLSIPRKSTYFTLLRNPISRFLACYHWAFRHKDRDYHWVPDIVRRGASLEDYVDLALDTGWYPGGLAPAHYYSSYWLEAGLIPPVVRNDRYSIARYVLDTYFSFIGITEHFDASLYCCCRTFGCVSTPYWALYGKSGSSNPFDLNRSLLRKIDKLCEIDMELYLHYRREFEQVFSQDLEYFYNKVGSFRVPGDNDAPMLIEQGR